MYIDLYTKNTLYIDVSDCVNAYNKLRLKKNNFPQFSDCHIYHLYTIKSFNDVIDMWKFNKYYGY